MITIRSSYGLMVARRKGISVVIQTHDASDDSNHATSICVTTPCKGWLLDLQETPDTAFAQGMIGPGVLVEPFENVIHAPLAGNIAAIAQTHHAITVEAANGAQILIHIGIDTVHLSGRAFRPLVRVGDHVQPGQALIAFDMNVILDAGKSLATPIVLVNADMFEMHMSLTPDQMLEDLPTTLFRLVPKAEKVESEEKESGGEVVSRKAVIPMPHGLHARPAAKIATLAKKFDSHVHIHHAASNANAKSPTSLLRLGVRKDDEIEIVVTGPDAAKAADAVHDLITQGAGDDMESKPAAQRTQARLVLSTLEKKTLPKGHCAGVTASPGLVIGPAFRLERRALDFEEYAKNAAQECQRLDDAIAQVITQLRTEETNQDDTPDIAQAHCAILEDMDLRAQGISLIETGKSAPAAWQHVMRAQAEALQCLEDPHLAARASDFEDLSRRVIMVMIDEKGTVSLPKGCVLLADDLYPSDMPALFAAGVAGFATIKGGSTSHAAILAAARGLPGIVAVGEALAGVKEGSQMVLDADKAQLRLLCTPEDEEKTRQAIQRKQERQERAVKQANAKAVLTSGEAIRVYVNLAGAADVEEALQNGAEGCGLLRTEFLFLGRNAPPSRKEQTEVYTDILTRMGARTTIIRTMDIGADKPANFIDFGREENPALGVRGVRVGMRLPELFETQVEAIFCAAQEQECHIMLPMITSLKELTHARQCILRIAEEVAFRQPVKIGVMVETPAAAVTAHLLAGVADFLSIGTNDLAQYTLAMDRTNEQMAPELDGLHPGVLTLIKQTVEGASARQRWVGVCGGLASEVVAVPILIGLGVTELSASSASIPQIKDLIRQLDMESCRKLAKDVLLLQSPEEIRDCSFRMLRATTDFD